MTFPENRIKSPSGVFMSKLIKLEVFGRRVMAAKSSQSWQMYYLSEDGKRHPALDIMVPAFVTESEIAGFIADLCHEWATDRYPDVRKIE
jgi:hypothetical protein